MAESHLSTAQRSESRQTDRPTPTRPSPGAPADHRSGDSIVGGAVPPLLRIPGQSLFHPGRGLVIFWRELAEWTLLARPLEVLLPCPSDHTNLVMQTPHLTLNTATHKTRTKQIRPYLSPCCLRLLSSLSSLVPLPLSGTQLCPGGPQLKRLLRGGHAQPCPLTSALLVICICSLCPSQPPSPGHLHLFLLRFPLIHQMISRMMMQ